MTPCIDHGRKGNRRGYASCYVGGGRANIKFSMLHRVAYCEYNGITLDDIEGLVVRHKCDNPRCIRGPHLTIGTQADNIQDAVKRGRHYTPFRRAA